MVALTLPRAKWPERSGAFGVYTAVIALVGVAMVGLHTGQLQEAAATPACWLMTGLALAVAAQSFVTIDRRGAPIITCPSLCFTFAILLCWGVAPAIVAQTASVLIVGLRLRTSVGHSLVVAAQYGVAFAAAYAVLAYGDPNPFKAVTFTDKAVDTATVAGAVGAWLVAFYVVYLVWLRLRWGSAWRRATDSLAYQTLFKAALILLSPVVAVAAHVNPVYVGLIFVPLYAVQRMARLSAERDRAARVDPLTGLANRRALQARFTDLATTDSQRPLALLLLDLDRFKHVNDALGHEVGDRLLDTVAQRLRLHEPADGMVGRLGGDEFAIIAPDLTQREAHELATCVRAALAEPIRIDGLPLDITASVGIAVYPQQGEDFTTLMRHADIAMYDAKRRGDTAAGYEPGSDPTYPGHLGLLTDFRRALESSPAPAPTATVVPGRRKPEIELHYQPQVALTTGEVVGVEALLRWQHPNRGLVRTAHLLHVAEQTAVMQLLTARVIDDVVAQVAAWRADGLSLRASLNVSARDLYSGEIVAQLSRRLTEYAVPPDQIQLEITESALMTDAARAHATIAEISSLGVAVALDDFGTGYSSLQHLRKLPLTEIKIDQSFVGGMVGNGDDAAIVRSTVELARALGLRTVAEGVENGRTWRMLGQIGCSLAQGWYTARPMPGDRFPAWLARYRHTSATVPEPAV